MARRRSDRNRAAERLRLLEVLDRVLDRGIVCDAWVSISVSGIELVAIDAHIVVASIETYLTHAELLQAASPAASSGPAGEQAGRRGADVEPESTASEAVVRAVEQYLRQIRRGDQPD